MTYGWVKDFALALMNRYSIAGTRISAGYNNQQDYILRIPALADDAQLYIATTARRIPAACPLSSLDCQVQDGCRVYSLPDDLFELDACCLLRMPDGRPQQDVRFYRIGQDKLMLPDTPPDGALLTYFRYPKPLGTDPDDETQLDNVPQAQALVPYYVAAHLSLGEDAFAYASLYNEFEARLARLGEPLRAQSRLTEDDYGFFDGEGLS